MNARTWYACAFLAATILGTGLAVEPAATSRALAAGDFLPEFASTDEQGQPWKSTEHIGDKILVLYSYPGDFAGCSKNAHAFYEGLAKLESQGVELVGISGDQAATHKLFKETHGLKHTLLADPKGELARLLGMPVSRGDNVRLFGKDSKLVLQPMHRADGTVLTNGAQTSLLRRPVTLARWTIVVARSGEIVSLRRDTNPATDAQEVLEVLATLQK